MKKLITLTLTLVVILTLTGCITKTDDTNEVMTITVLTSSGYEPYEMVDNEGNLTGFDIELMEALAAEAGYTVEWKDVAFEGIIASLQSGQEEIAIAGISPSPDRALIVDFSNVYYNSESGLTNVIISANDSGITSLNDLSGKVVSAQLGTVQASFLEAVKDEYGFTVDLRDNNTQIVMEIISGRIDALIVESAISDSILDANSGLSSIGFESYLDDTSGNAIAFAKGSEYVTILNNALITLQDNGTLDALIAKWFN